MVSAERAEFWDLSIQFAFVAENQPAAKNDSPEFCIESVSCWPWLLLRFSFMDDADDGDGIDGIGVRVGRADAAEE